MVILIIVLIKFQQVSDSPKSNFEQQNLLFKTVQSFKKVDKNVNPLRVLILKG